MTTLLKILVWFIVSGAGFMCYPLVANLLVMTGILSADNVAASFGHDMTSKVVVVWVVSTVLAAAAFAGRGWWTWIFRLAPIYLPSAFAIIYTLVSTGGA